MCHIPSHPWALRHRLCPAHPPTVCPTRSPTSPPYPTRLPRLCPLQRPEPSACSSGPSCLWPYQEHAESAQQHLLQGAFPAFPRRLVVPSPCLVTGSANTLLPDLRPQQTGGSLGAVPCFNVMSQHCTWQEFEEFFLNEPTGEQLKPPAPVKGSKAPLALCPEETPLPSPWLLSLLHPWPPTQGPWFPKVLHQQGTRQCSALGTMGTAPLFLCFRRRPKTDWPLGGGVLVHTPLLSNSLPKTCSRRSAVSTCSNAMQSTLSYLSTLG